MRSNYVLLSLFCLLMAVDSISQNATYRKSYDITLFDIAGGMVESPTGELVFAGGGLQAIATKLNGSGDVVWAKNYNSGFIAQFNDIKKVSTGGYILAGNSSSNGAILTRIDESGSLLWSMRYQYPDRAGKASSENANAVIETSDGGFLVGGSVTYFWDGVSSTTIDTTSAMGFKVNSSGALQWNKVWAINTANPDEHWINDVAESADGYFFMGESSEGTGTLNDDGDYPSQALLIKTTTTGTLTYLRRFGATGSSQGISAATRLNLGANAGKILLGGYDDVSGFLTTVDGTGATPTMGAFNRRLTGSAFGSIYMIQDIMENSDGNYSVIGTQLQFLSVALRTMILKINSSNGNLIFGRAYAPIGLSAILPEGGLAADQGYYAVMLDQQFTGFNFNVIRTDNAGNIGSAATGCAPTTITPTFAAYTVTLATPTFTEYSSMTGAATTPVITNVTPSTVVHCLVTACTPPAAATTVTATPGSICAGQSTTITASGPATGVVYNVFTAATGGTSQGATPLVVSPSATTTYYVETVNNADPNCVSTTRTPVTVTVNPAPVATAGSNSPVCEGQTLNLTSNTVAGATYSWTGPNGFTSALEDPSITGVTAAAAGTYSLTITAAGCPSVVSTVNVTVNTAPVATPGSDSPVCTGQDLHLTANTIAGATYSWTGPNGYTSTQQNPVITGAAPANAGTYTLTITSGGCTSAAATVTVVVSGTLTISASGNSPVCTGTNIELTATGGTTYSWTGPNGYTSNVQNPVITNAQAANAGIYTVTVQNASGCSNTAQVTVTVANPETISVTHTNILCNGASTGSATAVTTGTGPYTYSWSPSGGTGATASNLTAGTYTVSVNNGNGCISTGSAVITEPAGMVLATSMTPTSCTSSTGTATVTVTGGQAPYTFSWSPSGGTNATASGLTAGVYTVTVTDGNGCQKTASVTINSANGPTVAINSSSNVSCFGASNGSATASVTGGTPAYTYSWSPSGGNAATASNLTAGTYTVTVVDNAGCTAVATTTITSPAQSTITTSGTPAHCGVADGTASASATGGNAPFTYVWQPGNVSGQVLSNVPGGVYTVTATDATGCSATATYTVLTTGSLNVTVSPALSFIDPGESVNLTATVNPAIPGTVYSWNPPTGLSCTNCPDPVATPGQTTTYTVTATAPDGCSGTANATVDVKIICGDYFIPTIFSPNGDGKNDELCVLGTCITSMHLAIYDRWGEKVFESTDQQSCWDGTYKDRPMNSNSFVYKVELTFINGKTISEKGNISLVR